MRGGEVARARGIVAMSTPNEGSGLGTVVGTMGGRAAGSSVEFMDARRE